MVPHRASPLPPDGPARVALGLLAALLCLATPQRVDAQSSLPLDPLLDTPAVWSMDRAALEARFPGGFEWISESRGTARFPGGRLVLWDRPVGETLVRFGDETIDRVTISLYNRGDHVDCRDAEDFQRFLTTWRDLLAERTGLEPADLERREPAAVDLDGWLWRDEHAARLLEFSVRPERKSRGIPFLAEFARLRVAPIADDDFFRRHAGVPGMLKEKGDLRHAVEERPGGDVVVTGVPMVDQGAKGYCVVASVERVLRHYGREVDQHEMAQAAGADAAAGTSTTAMVDSLRRLSGRLGIRIHTHDDMIEARDLQEWAKLYNRVLRQDPARFPGAVELKTDPGVYYPPSAFHPPLLREARLTRTLEFERFVKDVREHVDEGVPLLWAVWLGLFREEGLRQVEGGHMRLVVGYNEANGQLLYSDSWGAGHELKRMSIENAFTMTLGLFTLEPSR